MSRRQEGAIVRIPIQSLQVDRGVDLASGLSDWASLVKGTGIEGEGTGGHGVLRTQPWPGLPEGGRWASGTFCRPWRLHKPPLSAREDSQSKHLVPSWLALCHLHQGTVLLTCGQKGTTC